MVQDEGWKLGKAVWCLEETGPVIGRKETPGSRSWEFCFTDAVTWDRSDLTLTALSIKWLLLAHTSPMSKCQYLKAILFWNCPEWLKEIIQLKSYKEYLVHFFLNKILVLCYQISWNCTCFGKATEGKLPLGNTNGGCIVCEVIYIFHCWVILIISFFKYLILWGHFCGMIGINLNINVSSLMR